MSKQEDKPPESSVGDSAHAIVKAALPIATTVLVPVLAPVAGLLPDLFSLLVRPPLERRRDEFLHSVDQRLRSLEERGLDLSALADNQQFVTTVVHATQAAVKTHRPEKLRALQECILNVAAGRTPAESRLDYFLAAVDEFSEAHLRALKLSSLVIAQEFNEHVLTAEDRARRYLYNRLEAYLGLDRADYALVDRAWKDLLSRGFVSSVPDNLPLVEIEEAARLGLQQRPLTLPLGEDFLSFISDHSANA
jgi:hypothetical protein